MLTQSVFVPIAIGFFGLGCGYFIWGGQTLFGFPKPSPEVDRTMGMWGFWMPGFMQFLTGIVLLIGLTWFQVFNGPKDTVNPLYMAAVAFTAYGIHWFAMAHRRYIGASAQPDAWMAIAFLILSLLGVYVFWLAPDIPVAIVFIGLSLIYASEIVARFMTSPMAVKAVGLFQGLTGIWLMYLTWATVVDFTLPHMHWWL